MKKAVTFIIAMLIMSIFATQVMCHSYNVIGSVLTTDIRALINGYEIPSYNVDGFLVIVGSDLKWYGFDVWYDDVSRISHVEYKGNNALYPWEPLPSQTSYQGSIGTKVMDVYDTDIIVLLNGKRVDSYNVDGHMAFRFSELSSCGIYKYDNNSRTSNLYLDLNTYDSQNDDNPTIAEDATSYYSNDNSNGLIQYQDSNFYIGGVSISINSVGGVNPTIYYRNETGKTIKYIHFTSFPVNAVGDKVYSSIGNKSTIDLVVTGPIETFDFQNIPSSTYYYVTRGIVYPIYTYTGKPTISYYDSDNEYKYTAHDIPDTDYVNCYMRTTWDCPWYNSTTYNIAIEKVTIIFMDNTEISFYY